MRTSEAFPLVGTPVDDLREIVQSSGPFLTVYLNTEAAVENAGDLAQRRWNALFTRFGQAGVPESVRELVDPLVFDAHINGDGLAVIADETSIRLVEHLPEAPESDRASWSWAPDLLPLIRWRQDRIPHVLALADRGGADLTAVSIRGNATDAVTGDWGHIAKDVANRLADLHDQVDARLVVLGGDVRAVQLISEAMRTDIAPHTRVIDYGRAVDGSGIMRDREVHRLLATVAAEETVALLERFKEERGQHDLAVEGAAETIEALQKSAVEILLLADDDATVTVGDEPFPISLDFSEQTDNSLNHSRRTAALVRAALATGATVRAIPHAGPIKDGVGGLLRWRDAK